MRDNGIPTDALESGKRKLLIVDDDQELVELMSDAFARDGRFDIKTANNGFDAGMLVKEYGPDLIVLLRTVEYAPSPWNRIPGARAFSRLIQINVRSSR
jgi:response regulator RpfG family c-di-GMP phosphodiesterase